jgi:hypothetical protein
MSNHIYPEFYNVQLDGWRDLSDAYYEIKVLLVDTGTAGAEYNAEHLSVEEAQGGIPEASKVATSPVLTGVTTGTPFGTLNTADTAFVSVSGASCEALLLFARGDDWTPAEAGLVIAWYDDVAGLPITPGGGNINCTVHASGWFCL